MKKIKTARHLQYLLILLIFGSCAAPKKLYTNYESPDYSTQKNWASLPIIKDKADKVPKKSNLKNKQDSAKVDVFFVHYTTYWISLRKRNANLKNWAINKTTDLMSIRYQASVFNESCKIYAPRYRQASIVSYFDFEGKGAKAFDLAYKDVKAAFKFYLEKYNKGRPFIIASHSQGSVCAEKLIKEFIETDPELYKRFVCGYLVGWANTSNNKLAVPCDSANQLGCVNTWQTTRSGTIRNKTIPNKYVFLPSNSSVNPLTWTRYAGLVGKEKNLGGAPIFMRKIQPNICDAQLTDNLLWIHHPKKLGYLSWVMHYHLFDYNLFYMNIRENVKLRVNTYLENSEK